jgi:hypothetical protein
LYHDSGNRDTSYSTSYYIIQYGTLIHTTHPYISNSTYIKPSRKNKEMAYNIMKIMTNPKTGKKVNVLLTDGLSQIWSISKLSEVVRITEMMEENSDSGHKYEVRGEPCKVIKKK